MKRIAAFLTICLVCAGMMTACRSGMGDPTTAATAPGMTTMPDMGSMLPDPEDTIDPTAGANDPSTGGTVDPSNGANDSATDEAPANTDPTGDTGDLRRALPRHRRGR